MLKVIFYQIASILLVICCWILGQIGYYPEYFTVHHTAINCVLIATLGGNLYCIRAVYLNKCVKGNWDENWELWYYLRPLASALSGFIAFIFLKAGLIVLEAEQSSDAGFFGFLAFAFIAGLNVDKFFAKLEDTAKSMFGIEKSRAGKESENN